MEEKEVNGKVALYKISWIGVITSMIKIFNYWKHILIDGGSYMKLL